MGLKIIAENNDVFLHLSYNRISMQACMRYDKEKAESRDTMNRFLEKQASADEVGDFYRELLPMPKVLQEQLDEKKSFAEMRGDLDKQASIMGALGLAGAMHVAPNLAMKAVKSTETGHRALAGTMSAGVKHGKNGQMLQPNARALMEYGVGPESLVDYNIGRRIGKRLGKYEDDPARQNLFLDRVTKKFNLDDMDESMKKEIDKVPVLGSFNRYLNGDTNKGIEKVFDRLAVPETTKLTAGQKAGNVAMLGAAGAVDPHILMQPAFSAGRKMMAKSPLGKKMLESGFDGGIEGKEIGKLKERAIDTFVSPGVLDTHRVGKFFHDNSDEKTLNAAKTLKNKMDMTNADLY